MPNTSIKSSTREQELPEVEVLLCTFNGVPFVGEFLDSLTRQVGVKIHLRVSDDGSTDETLKIVQSYENYFESCLIIKGPCAGPSSNFFSLLDKATFDFIALADQDDIWFPEHLINSVRRLKGDANPITMTFCQVLEMKNTSTKQGKIWPNIPLPPEFHEFFFQNFARGCTIVLKKELADLISRKDRDHAIMHDWWIYLVARSCGSTIFNIEPEIRYRIHEKNAVGHGPNFKSRVSKFLLNSRHGKWAPWDQLKQVQFQFQDIMLPQAWADLIWLFDIPNLKFKDKLFQIFFSGRRLRKSFLSNILVKFYLLLR
jgi:glycosyltransferase involved in cell wall biosynthesis